jgi:acid stress-induced BolA-like protein IbaG/YrbA
MDPEYIAEKIRAALDGAEVEVVDPRGDRHHFEARVVWTEFEGLGLVARHRKVYAAVTHDMGTNRIHALQLACLTPDELEERSKPQVRLA